MVATGPACIHGDLDDEAASDFWNDDTRGWQPVLNTELAVRGDDGKLDAAIVETSQASLGPMCFGSSAAFTLDDRTDSPRALH